MHLILKCNNCVPVFVFVPTAIFQNWPFHIVHSPNIFGQALALNQLVATSPVFTPKVRANHIDNFFMGKCFMRRGVFHKNLH
jgi:hypothetical protein